jgi:hypothetical protein
MYPGSGEGISVGCVLGMPVMGGDGVSCMYGGRDGKGREEMVRVDGRVVRMDGMGGTDARQISWWKGRDLRSGRSRSRSLSWGSNSTVTLAVAFV